jgi:hypothetical protein
MLLPVTGARCGAGFYRVSIPFNSPYTVPTTAPPEEYHHRVEFRPQRQGQSDTSDPGIGPACGEGRPREMQRSHDEQAHNRWGGSPAKVEQPRMLHPPPEQLCCSSGQRPRHQENTERGRAGPGESSGSVAQKGRGNEHWTGSDIAEGDRHSKILGTGPSGLSDRDPLDERQRRLPTAEGKQTDEHASGEEVKDHGVSS